MCVIKGMERPDLKIKYEKMNQTNKKYVNLMYRVLIVNTMSPLIALLVYKLFIHFTRGLDSDDYTLLVPVW